MKKNDLNGVIVELETTKRFQQRMSMAQTIEDYEDYWKSIQDSLVKVRNKITNACQSHPHYHGWNSKWTQISDKIPLIDYLLHARNADGHSTTSAHEIEMGTLTIRAGIEPCYLRGLTPHADKLTISHTLGSPETSFNPARMILLPAKDRGKLYPPPNDSDHNPPHILLNPVIEYYEQMVASAIACFTTSGVEQSFSAEGTAVFGLEIPAQWPLTTSKIAEFESGKEICSIYALPDRRLEVVIQLNNKIINQFKFTPSAEMGNFLKLAVSWKSKNLTVACNGTILIQNINDLLFSEDAPMPEPLLMVEIEGVES